MHPQIQALEILESYSGTNNQILYWKHKIFQENSKITKAQAEYILKYHAIPPKVAKRFVKIDPYFSDKIQSEKGLFGYPESIWVEKLLAESDKAFHIIGRLAEGYPLEFLWVPKCFIIRENKKTVQVDYSKYSVRPPLSHQPEAIEKLLVNDKFILADDQGLGKSMVATIASIESGAKKILIICPASLKINWKREIQLFCNKSIYIVDGTQWESGHKYYIINYDILKNFHEVEKDEEMLKTHIMDEGFDLMIVDECHMIQNSKTIRTKLVNDIAECTKRTWFLSGTPMTNRPINLYNLLKLVDAPVAYNWQTYIRRYCKAFQISVKDKTGKKRKVWITSGASNLEELRERIKPYFLRRLKSEVLDLPEKIITPVWLELKSKKYEDEMGEYLQWSENEGKGMSLSVHITKLMKVRMILSQEKIPYTCEVVDKLLDEEKKVIIFTNFTETLNRLAKYYGKKAVTLDGRTSKVNRQLAVDQFQENKKIRIFIANLRAGGVGHTLTEAEAVVMNDLSFVPSEHAQGEDRAYRIGTKNSVSIFYPVFENSIDYIVYKMLAEKKYVIDTVMGDNEFAEGFGMDLLAELSSL